MGNYKVIPVQSSYFVKLGDREQDPSTMFLIEEIGDFGT